MEANDSFISSKYDLRTRRIFVKHVSPDDGIVVEGWASVQSTQGYVILSPIIDLCYNNSRWGSTRPLIRQCGHAAHLGCVDTHVASIHQKSQAETPYDGRFAADIEDGEFLCPLCKQLCNVVVPAESLSPPKTKDEQMRMPVSQTNAIQEILETLHSSLSYQQGKTISGREAKRAINQYGNYLEHSMQVFSWDPDQGRKSKAQKYLHKAIKNWDFEEDEEDAFFSSKIGEVVDPLISDVLRLLRQQHIAWAAAGHTAAAAEASQRGVQKAGFEPPTSDPWPDFDSASKDSHTMLIELRRTLAAASSLYALLSERMNEKLEKEEAEVNSSGVSIVGYLLGNILKGEFWTSEESIEPEIVDEWKVLTALLSSLPCHVSKDESLSLRHEARAVSSQIWAIKASSNVIVEDCDTALALPPPPLSVRKVPGCENLKSGWGSMTPSEAMKKKLLPFRPALATGFLYIPLLSWDMTTLAGAVFSSMLSSDNLQVQDLHHIARTLLVGRMVQVLVTLNDREVVENVESPHFEADMDVSKESAAIVDLLNCIKSAVNESPNIISHGDKASAKVLAYVSQGILPFARTLLLLLRATTSTLRLRGKDSMKALDVLLESEDAMYIEDGMYFMKELDCPLPSELLSAFSQTDENNPFHEWAKLINRWLIAVATVDAYQGSRGNHLVYDNDSKKWIPKVSKIVSTSKQIVFKDVDDDESDEGEEIYETGAGMDISNESVQEAVDDVMESEDESEDEVVAWHPGFEMGDHLDGDVSSDEEMEHVEDMFDDEIDDILGLPSLPSGLDEIVRDTADDSVSSIYSWDQLEVVSPSDRNHYRDLEKRYAGVSMSAIIPYQAGFLGFKEPGPGPRGGSLESSSSKIMFDTSHLGLSHYSGKSPSLSCPNALLNIMHACMNPY